VTGIQVHQCVHAYRRGHQLVASSIALPREDADLVTRLSDLSGPLAGAFFEPYLTAYPLPTAPYYAVSRTWADKVAPRSGCVKTRTLLVPLEEWANCTHPDAVFRSIEEPQPAAITGKLSPVLIELSSTISGNLVVSRSHFEFVRRFFAEGVSPVVWMANPNPEQSLERLIVFAWPALRRSLAICTFCLQPRSLDRGLFDIMFAPASSLHRFASISQEHFVRSDDGRSAGPFAAWENRLTHRVFGASQNEDTPWDTEALAVLPGEATSVRLVYQLADLLAKVPTSPTAAVASLDVLGVLAPLAGSLADAKYRVLKTALDAAWNLSNTRDALYVLQLIAARIARPAFNDVAAYATEELKRIVSNRAASDLRTAADMVADVFSDKNEQNDSSAFVAGILEALVRGAKLDPSNLATLSTRPRIVKQLLDQNPGLVESFFDSVVQSPTRHGGIETLMAWITLLPPKTQTSVREGLLARIRGDCPASVALVLIADVDETTAPGAMNALLSSRASPHGLAIHVALESLAARFPKRIREAMPLHEQNRPEWAHVLASTYPLTLAGLRELLSDVVRDGSAQAEVLAQFLNTAYGDGVARWLRELNGCAGQVLASLLRGDTSSKAVKSALQTVANYTDDLHGTVLTINPEAVHSFVDSDGDCRLVHALMRDTVRTFLRGELDPLSYLSWLEPSWAQRWYAHRRPSYLVNLAWDTTHEADRLWSWLLILPQVSYSNHAEMIRELATRSLRTGRKREFPSPDIVIEVLRRSRELSPLSDHLQFCAQILAFCFDATSSPVGQLVAEAFPDIYLSLVRQATAPPNFGSLVAGWDWDKGKELRALVVDRFLRSSWDPADLALLAVDTGLLPKLFKRIKRAPHGTDYLSRMANSLANRSDSRAARASKDLGNLLRDPDFTVDWD
jgi:hypothetical protein